MARPDAELDRVRRESRGCLLCGGTGQTIVFHPDWAGDRVGYRNRRLEDDRVIRIPFPAEVAAHCQCAYGRWIRERTEEEYRSRIPSVAEIIDGVSSWLLDPPDESIVKFRRRS